jgi:hypothetical protein
MIRIIISICLLWVLVSQAILAQTLPQITCFTINDSEATFPFIDEPRTKVIFVIFNIKAEKEIESWTNPLVQKFVRKSGLMDAMLDAEFKTVTFLSQLQHTEFKAASNKVENQLPEELKSLSYYTKEPKTSIQTLLKNKADTSVLVVSSDGELIGFVSGGFTEEKLEKIEELIP